MLRSLGVFLVGLAIAGSAHAELVAYWDFNDTLVQTAGSPASLTVGFLSVGVGQVGYGTGTSENLPPGPYVEGDALRFYGLATVAEVGHVTISNLNLTGLSSPTISFAIEANSVFTVNDVFKLQYTLGGGEWQDITMPKPTAEFSVFSYTFNEVGVAGHNNVAFRIHFETVGELIGQVKIDNLQVNAVPEPGSLALVSLAGAGLVVWKLRRRRQA